MTKTRDLANLIADSKVGPSEIDTTGTYNMNALQVGGTTVIDSSQNIGVGVAPDTRWTSSYPHIDLDTGGAVYGTSNGVSLAANLYFDGSNWKNKVGGSGGNLMANYNGGYYFYKTTSQTNADTTVTLSERLRVDDNVDLRNGTSLQVGGTTVIDSSRAITATGGTMTGALTINLTSNNPQFRMQGNALWDFYSYNDDNFYINNSSGTVLGLLANKDAYFGKNLIVGYSVLSTYPADYSAIDIGSSASVQGYTGNNGVWLQSNLFMNTNGHWTSKSDDYSAMIELYDGNINFYNTASGTGTRTLLTPMTIRQSGNVGIGNASPSDYYAGASNLVIGSNNGTDNGLTIVTPQNKIGRIHFADGTSGASAYAGFIAYSNATDKMLFGAGSDGGTDFQIENGKCTVEGDLDVGGQLVSEAKRILDHPTQSHALAHYQELVCHNSITTSNKNTWMDVAFTGHSCIFKVYGATIENNDNALGGARLITNMLVTYGSDAFTTDAYKVTAMNGGGISSLEYRYLNSGGNAGSHRLQVRANWSTSTTMVVYTTITGMSETLSVAEDN